MATNDDDRPDGTSTSRRTFLKATGAATTVAAFGTAANGAAAAEEVDIDALLSDLSLEQKVAQMTKVAVGSSFDPSASTPDAIPGVDTIGKYFSELELGAILSGGASPPTFDAAQLVADINALQEYNLNNSSHGIPFLWGVDAVHGNDLVTDATVFPQRINMGATRNPTLVEEAERHTADSVAAMGAHWTYAPTTDLQRDPRWGRFFEGISEAPKLLGDISKARVEGLESNDRFCSTVKHFGAYSVPDNGNDRAAAQTAMRDLRERLLPPYEKALEGGAKTVMLNSGSVNGVPGHVSNWLIADVLRGEYGFDGVITTDYDDFYRLISNNDWAPDTDAGFRKGVKAGINAGIDMYMIGNTSGAAPGPVAFMDTLVGLVRDGEVPMKRIDESVRRILQLKKDLGLFQNPYADESKIQTVLGGAQDTSEQLAKESLVLLKNEPPTDGGDAALPLSASDSVLLTGPGVNADGQPTRHLMQHGGWTLGWQGIPNASAPTPRQNLIVDELRDAVGSVTHVPTTFDNARWWSNNQDDPNGNFEFTDQQETDLRNAAPNADAVVVVLGEGPHNEGFGDRNHLHLDEDQQAIVRAAREAADDGTPLVGVTLAGSPRGTAATHDLLDAVIFAGNPGSDTGVAVADTLVGDYNPSGKLAFNWPTSVGKVPNHHNAYPPLDGQSPLYGIGHGLSYTSFEYSNLTVTPGTVADPSSRTTVTVSVDVTNTGDVAGDHIVDVFNTQSYGEVIHPDMRLVGFERVSLNAGETATVEVEADLAALEVVPGDVPGVQATVVEAGEYELSVGGKTTTLTVENAGSPSGRGPMAGYNDLNGDGTANIVDVQELFNRIR